MTQRDAFDDGFYRRNMIVRPLVLLAAVVGAPQ